LSEEDLSPRLRELATTRMLDRARVLGAAMRVAYIITAGQGGVLPKTQMKVKRGKLILSLPGKLSRLASDRLYNRLRQCARLVGREPMIEV
jgi:exopolyphosphatase/guanosine-5'-triphosphate,3'-diphosphate pyrophosphatase